MAVEVASFARILLNDGELVSLLGRVLVGIEAVAGLTLGQRVEGRAADKAFFNTSLMEGRARREAT